MLNSRRDYPGAIHLLRVRGRADDTLFFSAEAVKMGSGSTGEHVRDLQYWEHLLRRACDRQPAKLHGYIWLPNEAIMLVQRFARPINVIMATVCGQFSRYLRKRGRVEPDRSPYASRYQSITITPASLPYAIRHVYWRATTAGLCNDPADYPFSSFALHCARIVAPWFRDSVFLDAMRQRGYVGRDSIERFLRRPESPRHLEQFSSAPGRKPRVAGERSDVDEAVWRSEHPASAPTLERITTSVAALLRNQNSEAGSQSVLGKALITWHATQSGAATLAQMGQWFNRTPTTLRAAIESHRRRNPDLFRQSLLNPTEQCGS